MFRATDATRLETEEGIYYHQDTKAPRKNKNNFEQEATEATEKGEDLGL
jgi:hypothetical protein